MPFPLTFPPENRREGVGVGGGEKCLIDIAYNVGTPNFGTSPKFPVPTPSGPPFFKLSTHDDRSGACPKTQFEEEVAEVNPQNELLTSGANQNRAQTAG